MEVLIVLTLIVSIILNLALFFFIIIKITIMAKTLTEFDELLNRIDERNAKIAADVERLWQKLDDAGLTGTEEQAIYDRITSALAALTATDDRTPEETPEEPEEPEA